MGEDRCHCSMANKQAEHAASKSINSAISLMVKKMIELKKFSEVMQLVAIPLRAQSDRWRQCERILGNKVTGFRVAEHMTPNTRTQFYFALFSKLQESSAVEEFSHLKRLAEWFPPAEDYVNSSFRRDRSNSSDRLPSREVTNRERPRSREVTNRERSRSRDR